MTLARHSARVLSSAGIAAALCYGSTACTKDPDPVPFHRCSSTAVDAEWEPQSFFDRQPTNCDCIKTKDPEDLATCGKQDCCWNDSSHVPESWSQHVCYCLPRDERTHKCPRGRNTKDERRATCP